MRKMMFALREILRALTIGLTSFVLLFCAMPVSAAVNDGLLAYYPFNGTQMMRPETAITALFTVLL